jgi:hypothetical protein
MALAAAGPDAAFNLRRRANLAGYGLSWNSLEQTDAFWTDRPTRRRRTGGPKLFARGDSTLWIHQAAECA